MIEFLEKKTTNSQTLLAKPSLLKLEIQKMKLSSCWPKF